MPDPKPGPEPGSFPFKRYDCGKLILLLCVGYILVILLLCVGHACIYLWFSYILYEIMCKCGLVAKLINTVYYELYIDSLVSILDRNEIATG